MAGGKKLNIDGLAAPKPPASSSTPETERVPKKDDVLISWNGLNFERGEKTKKWYMIAIGAAVLLFVYLAFSRDWFMVGIFIVLLAVSAWYLRSAQPAEVTYVVTPIGIWAGDHLFPFDELHSFWMVYNQQVKMLYLASLKKYLPSKAISLKDVDPVVLKSILTKHLPEQEERGEDLIDKLVRIVGL